MKYLGSDGLLVLRIVTLQSGVIFGTELCAQIWRSFFGDFTIKRAKSLPRINDLDERGFLFVINHD